jgi:hypothetical protein
MEAICSSETSVATQQTTQRYLPEYSTLQPQYIIYTASQSCVEITTNYSVLLLIATCVDLKGHCQTTIYILQQNMQLA